MSCEGENNGPSIENVLITALESVYLVILLLA